MAVLEASALLVLRVVMKKWLLELRQRIDSRVVRLLS